MSDGPVETRLVVLFTFTTHLLNLGGGIILGAGVCDSWN